MLYRFCWFLRIYHKCSDNSVLKKKHAVCRCFTRLMNIICCLEFSFIFLSFCVLFLRFLFWANGFNGILEIPVSYFTVMLRIQSQPPEKMNTDDMIALFWYIHAVPTVPVIGRFSALCSDNVDYCISSNQRPCTFKI